MEQTLACMGYFDYLVCRGLGGGGGGGKNCPIHPLIAHGCAKLNSFVGLFELGGEFNFNSKEIIVNLLAVISVHWKGKGYRQFIMPK